MKILKTGLACLLILSGLVLFSWKVAAWLMPAAPKQPAPFALIVQEVQFVPVSPYEVADGYDTKVVVVLDHVGPTPSWWGGSNDNLGVGSYADEALYYQMGVRRQRARPPDSWTAPFLWAPIWDEARQRYVATYLVDLAHVPAHSGPVMLRGHLAVGMMRFQQKPLSPAILVSIPVRRPGQVVFVPPVSHDPMLTIEDVQMTKYTQAKRVFNGGTDTRVLVMLQYSGPVPLINPGCATGYPQLTDDYHHEIVPRSMSYHGMRDLADGSNGKIPRGRRFQIEYGIQSMPEFAKSKTVTLTDFASAYNNWPLSYHLVLHDAKNSLWTTPGKKPWSSHPRVLEPRHGSE